MVRPIVIKKKRTRAEQPSAVKAWRFEIIGLTGESRKRWHELQDQARDVVNLWWQVWCARHVMAGNNLAIVDWMREFRAARKEGRTPPKCPVSIMPPDRGQPSIHRVIAARVCGSNGSAISHNRTITLLQNLITKRLTGKDCDGVWNLWQAVLACRQGQPGCEKDQPIPFDKQSSTLPVRVDDREQKGLRGSKWRFDVTLAREQVEGKEEDRRLVRCASIHEQFTIIAKGSGEAIIKRIASKEYEFKGSQIFFSESKGKWFATLCYSMPGVERGSPGEGTALLRPGKRTPWKMRIGGRSCFRGGVGRHVTATRQRLLTSRWTEQETYRWAGNSRRGHGRKRALGPIEKLRNSWRDFVSGYNATLTTEIVRECVSRGAGTLIYCQPIDKFRDSRFLSYAGKIEGRRDGSMWDWADVATKLAWKCKEAGIHLVVRKEMPKAPRAAGANANGNGRKNGTPRKANGKGNGRKVVARAGAQ